VFYVLRFTFYVLRSYLPGVVIGIIGTRQRLRHLSGFTYLAARKTYVTITNGYV
jgi:hypothetical protein